MEEDNDRVQHRQARALYTRSLADKQKFEVDKINFAKDMQSEERTGRVDIASSQVSEDELKAIYAHMEALDGDILKTAMMATTEDEVRDYMHAAYHIQKNSEKLCAFMNMGKEGIISRLFCAYTKSSLSFASMRQASAPGQVSFVNMNAFMQVGNDILKD